MSKLQAHTALGGFSREWLGVEVNELTEYELVSLACVAGQDAVFKRRYKSVLKSALPQPGQILPAEGGSSMWLEPGKYLIMLGQGDENLDQALAAQFKESAYAVLLSDGWVCLRISGERTLDVFERFISLDMRAQPPDFAARTRAHHMAVIVVTLLDGSYLLLTPRSSSQSFLETLIHTIDNVMHDMGGPS